MGDECFWQNADRLLTYRCTFSRVTSINKLVAVTLDIIDGISARSSYTFDVFFFTVVACRERSLSSVSIRPIIVTEKSSICLSRAIFLHILFLVFVRIFFFFLLTQLSYRVPPHRIKRKKRDLSTACPFNKTDRNFVLSGRRLWSLPKKRSITCMWTLESLVDIDWNSLDLF